MIFTNEVVNKKLQNIISLTLYIYYGSLQSSLILDKVKNLTSCFAKMSVILLSLEDLRVPYQRNRLIGLIKDEIDVT